MSMALCRGIRERYPEWCYLIDGDGGDENQKDYPIEVNPGRELFRSEGCATGGLRTHLEGRLVLR